MREESFTNREITKMFEEQSRDLKQHMTDALRPLTDYQREANGKMAAISKWKERVSGGLVVVIFLIPTIFGMMGWMAYEIVNFDMKIQHALSGFELEGNITK